MSAKHKLNAAYMSGSFLIAILVGAFFQSTAIALGSLAFLVFMDFVAGNIRK